MVYRGIEKHFNESKSSFYCEVFREMSKGRSQTDPVFFGHIPATITHYVSKSRLKKLGQSDIRFLVMTGDEDNVRFSPLIQTLYLRKVY
jgi:hypothetical protein